ncbi:hypothetical protein AYO45_03245 [Gammaproteobacteria bacterium SCGC AG-212-F23]|nr:hypothetical protein AYO45_03245 [Gammaproteobacteria bacterium SCGC AG-212-F23]
MAISQSYIFRGSEATGKVPLTALVNKNPAINKARYMPTEVKPPETTTSIGIMLAANSVASPNPLNWRDHSSDSRYGAMDNSNTSSCLSSILSCLGRVCTSVKLSCHIGFYVMSCSNPSEFKELAKKHCCSCDEGILQRYDTGDIEAVVHHEEEPITSPPLTRSMSR